MTSGFVCGGAQIIAILDCHGVGSQNDRVWDGDNPDSICGWAGGGEHQQYSELGLYSVEQTLSQDRLLDGLPRSFALSLSHYGEIRFDPNRFSEHAFPHRSAWRAAVVGARRRRHLHCGLAAAAGRVSPEPSAVEAP